MVTKGKKCIGYALRPVGTKCAKNQKHNKNTGRRLKRETESGRVSCLKFTLGTKKRCAWAEAAPEIVFLDPQGLIDFGR